MSLSQLKMATSEQLYDYQLKSPNFMINLHCRHVQKDKMKIADMNTETSMMSSLPTGQPSQEIHS